MKLEGIRRDIALSIFWSVGSIGTLLYVLRLTSFFAGIPVGFYNNPLQPYDLFMVLPFAIFRLTDLRKTLPHWVLILPAAAAAHLVAKFIQLVLPEEGPADLFSALFAIASAAILAYYLGMKKKNVPLMEREIPKVDLGPTPLTLDEKGELVLPSKTVDFHMQITGGTGTGKTRYVIKPLIRQDIVQNKIGCFIYDVKSNMQDDITYYAHEAARIGDLYYFDLAHPGRSMTWNPLAYGTADEIANRVFCALYYNSDKASQYYSELASAFLNNLITLLKKDQKVITFQDLYQAVSEIETFKALNALCAKYKNTQQADFFYQNWLSKPKKQRQEELTGLLNKLQRFTNREWSYLINSRTPEINIDEVFDRGKILYFGIAGQIYPDDSRALSILVMMEISRQVARRTIQKPKKAFRVYLDEFYNMAYDQFINILNKARESKIDFILAFQALADLNRISPEFAEEVSINTRTKVILAQDDSGTAEFFSNLLGTEKVKEKVYSYDTRQGLGATPAGYSEPEPHRFRVNPDTLKELPEGEAIVRTIFPAGPVIRRIKLQTAVNLPKHYTFKEYMKERPRLKEETEKSGTGNLKDLADMRTAKAPVSWINDEEKLKEVGKAARRGLNRPRPPKA